MKKILSLVTLLTAASIEPMLRRTNRVGAPVRPYAARALHTFSSPTGNLYIQTTSSPTTSQGLVEQRDYSKVRPTSQVAHPNFVYNNPWQQLGINAQAILQDIINAQTQSELERAAVHAISTINLIVINLSGKIESDKNMSYEEKSRKLNKIDNAKSLVIQEVNDYVTTIKKRIAQNATKTLPWNAYKR